MVLPSPPPLTPFFTHSHALTLSLSLSLLYVCVKFRELEGCDHYMESQKRAGTQMESIMHINENLLTSLQPHPHPHPSSSSPSSSPYSSPPRYEGVNDCWKGNEEEEEEDLASISSSPSSSSSPSTSTQSTGDLEENREGGEGDEGRSRGSVSRSSHIPPMIRRSFASKMAPRSPSLSPAHTPPGGGEGMSGRIVSWVRSGSDYEEEEEDDEMSFGSEERGFVGEEREELIYHVSPGDGFLPSSSFPSHYSAPTSCFLAKVRDREMGEGEEGEEEEEVMAGVEGRRRRRRMRRRKRRKRMKGMKGSRTKRRARGGGRNRDATPPLSSSRPPSHPHSRVSESQTTAQSMQEANLGQPPPFLASRTPSSSHNIYASISQQLVDAGRRHPSKRVCVGQEPALRITSSHPLRNLSQGHSSSHHHHHYPGAPFRGGGSEHPVEALEREEGRILRKISYYRHQ